MSDRYKYGGLASGDGPLHMIFDTQRKKAEGWYMTLAEVETRLAELNVEAHALASGTPTRRAETTGSVAEGDGGPVAKPDAQPLGG